MKSIIEKYVGFMEKIARDNRYGYDQRYRWGEKNDFDCSSFTITALEYSGIPAKKEGATYTGNMKNVLLKLGFEDVKSKVDIVNGRGLERGDILLNEIHHVAVYTGNNTMVQASLNEKGSVSGGISGDQNGKEIYISTYKNYHRGWNCVLRLKKEKFSNTSGNNIIVDTNKKTNIVEQKDFIVNGKNMKLDAILIEGRNYVSLQSLKKVGVINVTYDNVNKIAVISNK